MADTRSHEPADVDPRKAMAQRYLERARAELAAKEAERPVRRQGEPDSNGPVTLGDLRPRMSGSGLYPPAFTHASRHAFGSSDTVVLRSTQFRRFGRTSYRSANGNLVVCRDLLRFSILSGTDRVDFKGETNPDEALRGDWRDWFWHLPSTVGMFAAAAGIGYLLSLPFPNARWEVIGVTTLLLYPILQLSCLETGSPLSPFSLPILTTLGTRPLMWVSLYGVTFVGALLLSTVAKSAWRDPPYLTVMVMGPLVTIAILIYGLLLGTAARWLSLKGR